MLRAVTGADDLEQEPAQPLVRPGGVPVTFDGGVDLVHQPRSASPRSLRLRLDHQPSGDQLGEVLPDGVVVERELLVELGDPDRVSGASDVPEDRVARWVAKRPGLPLQRRVAGRHGCLVTSGSSVPLVTREPVTLSVIRSRREAEVRLQRRQALGEAR